jgi:fructokinase
MQGAPTVVGTGLIALDKVFAQGSKHVRHWAGGTCANVLTILSYLGWHAYPVARLNGDAAAVHVIRDLRRWGVRLSLIQSSPATRTPVVLHRIVHSTNGAVRHQFSWEVRTKPWLLAKIARTVAAEAPKADVFFLDRLSPGAVILARHAADHGAIVFFEPTGVGDRNLFQQAAECAHIVKYSRDHARTIRPALLGKQPFIEIETLGRNGLRYRTSQERSASPNWTALAPFRPTAMKDAGGAGDWCTAGIINSLGRQGLKGLTGSTAREIRDAINWGQALAAWNCGFEGARAGMYHRPKRAFKSDIDRIIEHGPSRIPKNGRLIP